MMDGPWREPPEETVDLYPKLVVHDGRLGGAITVGRSRLPVSALLSYYFKGGWDDVVECWGDYLALAGSDFAEEDLTRLLQSLMELHGEFGRLLLVLADAERCEAKRGNLPPWWETQRHRKRVADQLRRCLQTVEAVPAEHDATED